MEPHTSTNTSGLRRRPLAIAVAIGALALASGPMQSLAASSSASITDIVFSVVDLDPNDGITSGFEFIDDPIGPQNGVRGTVGAGIFDNNDAVELVDVRQANPFPDTAASATRPGADARIASSENSVAFSGSAGTQARYGGGILIGVYSTEIGYLELTANTRFIITGNYSVSAFADDACGADSCEEALAGAHVQMQSRERGSQIADYSVTAQAQRGGGVIGNGTKSGSFEVAIDNTLNAATGVYFGINAGGQGHGGFTQPRPPPVPEPETWALMLVGLGALGAVSSGRRRRLTRL